MNLTEWAKREVEIACGRENPDRKEGEFDYGCACYGSALKAFESLAEDGHSGTSIRFTKNILDCLIDGKPLTPIEDTDDVWDEKTWEESENKIYQCLRMSALFKTVFPDGRVEYSDNDQCYCVDLYNTSNTYHFGLVNKIIREMFPIEMPYMPAKPIKVYCEDFLTDRKNGDLDTVGVLYGFREKDGFQERIEINRFFRAPEEGEEKGWIEISKEEYEERKARKL